MAIVGTAYVATKVISNNLSKDIKKAVEGSLTDVKPAMKKVGDELGKEMGKAIGESTEREIKESVHRTSKDTSIASRFKEMGSNLASSMTGMFKEKATGDLGDFFGGMGKTLMPLFYTALVPLIAVGLQVINAFVAQAVALLGAIGPAIAAAGVVAGGALVALGVAGAAAMLAFTTQTPMLERFKEVASAIKDEFSAVGEAIQVELLPRLAEAMSLLTATIPTLESGMAKVGKAIGEVAIEFAEMITSAENLSRLDQILSSSAEITRDFGGAFTNLTESALILLAAASPLTEEFAAWVRHLTEGWTASLNAAESTGALAEWFDRAGDTLKQLGGIFGAFGRGLVNVFQAGAGEGQILLDKIEAIARRFEEWTESASGQNALQEWFANANAVGSEFSGLIGDIGRAFGELFAQNPDASVEFIRALREAVPALVGAVPGIVALVTAFAEMISTLGESGMLGLITGGLSLMLQTLTALMQIPILGFFVQLGVALTPLWVGLSKVGLLMPVLNALWGAMTAALGALAAALGISIGWLVAIIAAIVAVIAVIVYAIKHWDEIKAKILEVWENVKEATSEAVDAIKDWFQGFMDKLSDVGDWFSRIWDSIVEKTKSVVKAIMDFFKPVTDFFSAIFPTILGVFQAFWGTLFTLLMLPVRIFVGLVLLAWEEVKGFFTSAWNFVSGWISDKWNSLKEALSGPINAAKEKISSTWADVKAAFSAAWSWLTGWLSDTWNTIKDKLSKPVEEAKKRIVAAWDAIKDRAGDIWDSFANGVAGAVATVKGKLNGVIDAINRVINGINKVIDGANSLPGPDLPKISNIPRLARGGVVSPYGGGTLALIAEAGRAERVEPLDSQGLSKRDRALINTLSMSTGPLQVRVFIGDKELTQMIRVEQDRREYTLSRVLAGGRVA